MGDRRIVRDSLDDELFVGVGVGGEGGGEEESDARRSDFLCSLLLVELGCIGVRLLVDYQS